MHETPRFPPDVIDAIDRIKGVRIRAGSEPHAFTGVWAVIVDGRVFVRSRTLRPNGWYLTFLGEPVGAIHVTSREIPIRAIPAKYEPLLDAIDEAYRLKYDEPSAARFVKHLTLARARATTTELVPDSTPPKTFSS